MVLYYRHVKIARYSAKRSTLLAVLESKPPLYLEACRKPAGTTSQDLGHPVDNAG